MKKFKSSSEEVLVADFDDICKSAKVIGFNENVIEVKGVFTFHKEGYRNFLDKIIDEDTFNIMTAQLKTFSAEPQNIVVESKTKPTQTLVINLEALKNDLMISYQDGETISLNNFVFTSSMINFNGEALNFSQRVIYLGFEDLSRLKNYMFDQNDDK